MIPPAQLRSMNGLLERLEYPEVGQDWSEAGSPLRVAPSGCERHEEAVGRYVEALLTEGVGRFGPELGDEPASCWVSVEDVGRRWVLDTRTGSVVAAGQHEATGGDWGIVTTSAVLVAVAEGARNLGEALRKGAIRYVGTGHPDVGITRMRAFFGAMAAVAHHLS